MSLVLADRVRQTSTTTGSGTFTLDGSVTGFQSFSAVGDGNTTYYTITLDAQWEVGIGTYSAGTLTRDTVISSSTGSKIVFGAGTKDVFVTLPSQKAVTAGTDATLTKLTTPTVQATNSGGLSLKNSAGTTQISMGAGGGDNISVNVSTNMNGSNAQIDISPTGTGHVHMKPSGTGSIEVAPTNVGTMDNMTIGATTARNGTFLNIAATTGTVSTAPSAATDIVNKTYADGLAAAMDLKATDPDGFALLATHDVPFRFSHDGIDMRARQKVILTDRHGQVTGVTVSQHMAGIFDLDQQVLDRYYPAFIRFLKMLRAPEYEVSFTLKSGECVAFDNQRILHGRRAYDPTSGSRFLRGCYTDRGEMRSKYRSLRRDGEIRDHKPQGAD